MFDLISLIKLIGYLGIFFIVFAESGLLVGFFLPGDSLLFTAGFLASQNFLDLKLLMVITFVAAVMGDSIGYTLGRRFGPRIFNKDDSLVFNRENVTYANNFYRKHGGKAIILARFMPVVRTLAPILAGVGTMRYSLFLFYNLTGAVLWAIGLSALGYYLGAVIPNVDRYILPIVALIVLISILPGVIHLVRNSKERQRLKEIFKKALLFIK